ncbi:MAG: hypothetical protein ACOYM9_15440, partial [Bradymonadia bacterium]
MGLVLAARDPDLRRTVAVKTLIDPQRVEPTQLARFVVEAQVTSNRTLKKSVHGLFQPRSA